LRERERVSTIGESFGGMVVGFEEDAIDASGYSCAG
jgi:hypothetical protein